MFLDLPYRYMVLFTHPSICWLDFAQGPCWSYVVGSMMVTNSSKTVGGTGQGNIIFATVRARWESVSTSATHTVLLAGL